MPFLFPNLLFQALFGCLFGLIVALCINKDNSIFSYFSLILRRGFVFVVIILLLSPNICSFSLSGMLFLFPNLFVISASVCFFLDLLKLKLCLLFKILDICMNVFGRVLPGPRLREPDSLSTWRLMTWRVLSTRRWALELLLWARSPRARARAVDYRALARWRTLTASFGLSALLPRRPLSWKLDDPRILSFLCQATVHLLWDPHIEKKSLAVRI